MTIVHMDEIHHMANNIMVVDHPYWILNYVVDGIHVICTHITRCLANQC